MLREARQNKLVARCPLAVHRRRVKPKRCAGRPVAPTRCSSGTRRLELVACHSANKVCVFDSAVTWIPSSCLLSCPIPGSKTDIYENLLHRILPTRLAKHRNRRCRVLFEDSSDLKLSAIKEWVTRSCQHLFVQKKVSLRYPPMTDLKSPKQEPCLAVADYVLGVTQRYLSQGSGTEATFRTQFERLRNKIRLVRPARQHSIEPLRHH